MNYKLFIRSVIMSIICLIREGDYLIAKKKLA